MSRFTGKKLQMIKRGAFYGVLTLASLGLGITGLALTVGAVYTGVSIASIGLSAIWGTLSGRAIKRAYEGKPEKIKAADSKSVRKQKLKNAKFRAKEERKVFKKEYSTTKSDAKTTKKSSIASATTDDEKRTAALVYTEACAAGKVKLKGDIKSLPLQLKRYKLTRALAIMGATFGLGLGVFSALSTTMGVTSADAAANESANYQRDMFLDKQETINDASAISISVASTVGAIAGAVTAKRARKNNEERLIQKYYGGPDPDPEEDDDSDFPPPPPPVEDDHVPPVEGDGHVPSEEDDDDVLPPPRPFGDVPPLDPPPVEGGAVPPSEEGEPVVPPVEGDGHVPPTEEGDSAVPPEA